MNTAFHDHGIDVPLRAAGRVRVTCPRCSHERRKAKDKCLSVDADEGLWHCFHCGWSGSLHTRPERPRERRRRESREILLHHAHVAIVAASDVRMGRQGEWSEADRQTVEKAVSTLLANPPGKVPVPRFHAHRIPPDPLLRLRTLVAEALEVLRHA